MGFELGFGAGDLKWHWTQKRFLRKRNKHEVERRNILAG